MWHFRKHALALAALAALWCAASDARAGARWMLGLREGAPAQLVTALGFTVLEARADLGLYLVSAPDGLDVAELAGLPAVRACCRFLEPDQIVVADQISLAFIERRSNKHQRGRVKIEDKIGPGSGFGEASVRVAILDTGVDFDHPDLAGHLGLAGQDYVDGDPWPAEAHALGDADGDGNDDEAYGHGTHAAGLVAALAAESPVEIVPFRVLDPEGQGHLFHVVLAVHDALASGARIIQMSLSCAAPSAALHEAVARAHAHGALIIASAGNEGSRAPRYPAAEPGVLAVAAAAANGVLLETSSYGTHVGLCAEGEGVLSAYPGAQYATWTGSSMATSLVTAAAARAWCGIDATLAQLRALAQDVDGSNPGKEGELGIGLLRVQNPFSE
jgi:subtilisin family serine protease